MGTKWLWIITEQFGLVLASAPICTGYEGEQPIPVQEEQAASAIEYPVIVELFTRPSIKAIPGSVRCRPQD